MDFDVVPFEDIMWGKRLGAGSFGSVFKGTYLGIDIAIKEILPSTEYDVHKYFEREWRIMRECRHPNIVLFLGLSKAPEGDGRVFIISEYVPRGNLRQYILSTRPFPWRLRISFATDVARAVAYLHARSCIHRDLKGENLLITSNDRVKVTDFGFARIASRNAEEMKRMTYCGTDLSWLTGEGYMSPEIINGFEIDLPTDVFSLGIIFVEILCRRLVDGKTFIRQAPHFTLDAIEVYRRASPGYPSDFLMLALECCREDPATRPTMPIVLARLRKIEAEVLSRVVDDDMEHVGSIRVLQHGGKRAMPVSEPAIADHRQLHDNLNAAIEGDHRSEAEREEDHVANQEREAIDALKKLEIDIDGKGAKGSKATDAKGEVVMDTRYGDGKQTWRTARWSERPTVLAVTTGTQPGQKVSHVADVTPTGSNAEEEMIKKGKNQVVDGGGAIQSLPQPVSDSARQVEEVPDVAASTMTVKGSQDSPPDTPIALAGPVREPAPTLSPSAASHATQATSPGLAQRSPEVERTDRLRRKATGNIAVKPKLSPIPSPVAVGRPEAGLGGSQPSTPTTLHPDVPPRQPSPRIPTKAEKADEEAAQFAVEPAAGTHRFTLVDKDALALMAGKKPANFPSTFAAFSPKALAPSTRCPVCQKRLGHRPALQCDDCEIIVHIGCSHSTARDCTGGDGRGSGRTQADGQLKY